MKQAAHVLGIHESAGGNALERAGVPIFKHRGKRFVLRADLKVFAATFPKQSWTADEEAIYRNLWGYRPVSEIAKILKRSETALMVQANRLRLTAVAAWPGVLTESTLAPLLVMDRKSVWRLMLPGSGALPAITLYKRNKPVQVVYEDQMCRWLKRPENWVYLTDTERITHPPFAQAIAAGKRKWNDAWLTPGEAASLLGIHHKTVNKYIHRGSLRAIKHGNWRIQRSSVERLRDCLNYHRQFAAAD